MTAAFFTVTRLATVGKSKEVIEMRIEVCTAHICFVSGVYSQEDNHPGAQAKIWFTDGTFVVAKEDQREIVARAHTVQVDLAIDMRTA